MSGILCAAPGTLLATAAAANITYVTSATNTAAGGTTISVTMPTITAGDVAFFLLGKSSNGAIATAPTGFTLISTLSNGTNNGASLWYKVLTGSESGTAYTVTTSVSADAWAAAIIIYRGANATPLDATPTTATFTSGTSYSYPTITTVTANSRIVRFATSRRGTAPATYTPPSTPAHVERFDIGIFNNLSADQITACDYLPGSTGATGTATGTLSAAAAGIMFTVALKPA